MHSNIYMLTPIGNSRDGKSKPYEKALDIDATYAAIQEQIQTFADYSTLAKVCDDAAYAAKETQWLINALNDSGSPYDSAQMKVTDSGIYIAVKLKQFQSILEHCLGVMKKEAQDMSFKEWVENNMINHFHEIYNPTDGFYICFVQFMLDLTGATTTDRPLLTTLPSFIANEYRKYSGILGSEPLFRPLTDDDILCFKVEAIIDYHR